MSLSWLALVVGNTRLHWGFFDQGMLVATWHTHHLSELLADQTGLDLHPQNAQVVISSLVGDAKISDLLQNMILPIDLWLASVVPAQTHLWKQVVPNVRLVLRSRIHLNGIYSTLGIDRAINLIGAKQTLDWPILVIDSGTALTLTAGMRSSIEGTYDGSVYGGAILPGVKLQFDALKQQTALGSLDLGSWMPTTPSPETSSKQSQLPEQLPERWAGDSEGAIASGIAYSLTSTCLDYINDWWQMFPKGSVVFTGGDGRLLYQYLQQRTPEIASRVLIDDDLMFKGMQAYRRELTT